MTTPSASGTRSLPGRLLSGISRWFLPAAAIQAAIALLAILLLTGCESSAGAPLPAVIVKGDTYCDVTRKIVWSRSDTPDTVMQIIAHNAKFDRLCVQPKGTS